MISVCVHGALALHRGKIALVEWILMVSLQRFGACHELGCEGGVCILKPLRTRSVCSGWREGRDLRDAFSLGAVVPLH